MSQLLSHANDYIERNLDIYSAMRTGVSVKSTADQVEAIAWESDSEILVSKNKKLVLIWKSFLRSHVEPARSALWQILQKNTDDWEHTAVKNKDSGDLYQKNLKNTLDQFSKVKLTSLVYDTLQWNLTNLLHKLIRARVMGDLLRELPDLEGQD